MRPSSGVQEVAGRGFGFTLAIRTGRIAGATLARVAAATEAGVGWRRRGCRASEAEMVATLRSPRPTAMSGIRKVGSGRSGTTETRAPEAGRPADLAFAERRRGWVAAKEPVEAGCVTVAEAARTDVAFAPTPRRAASQRARS